MSQTESHTSLDPTNISSDNLTSIFNFTETTRRVQEEYTLKSLFIEMVMLSDHALIIYSCLLGLTIVLTGLRSFGFFSYCLSASSKLHSEMFSKVVLSPMVFFNSNTSGRILNRFSKDVGNVDEILPGTMIDTLQVGFLNNSYRHKYSVQYLASSLYNSSNSLVLFHIFSNVKVQKI